VGGGAVARRHRGPGAAEPLGLAVGGPRRRQVLRRQGPPAQRPPSFTASHPNIVVSSGSKEEITFYYLIQVEFRGFISLTFNYNFGNFLF